MPPSIPPLPKIKSLAQLQTKDHDLLTGLTDDDHTQYLLSNGSRALTGNWDAGSFTITAAGLTVDTTNGIDIYGGSDTDHDLITLQGVTGTPTFGWDESSNNYTFTHSIQQVVAQGGGGLYIVAPPSDGGAGDTASAVFGIYDGGSTTLRSYMTCRQIDSSTSVDIGFITTISGVGTAERATLLAGLVMGSPTGGDKGIGTINATAVYDDNVLLTCYVFDAVLDGSIDDSKWDAKVPDKTIPVVINEEGEIIPESIEVREHDAMRKFKARLGTDTDPLDIDKYTEHWKTKRHLTSLPNEVNFDPLEGMPSGSWIQRLIETAEIQAVHISTLNDRLKLLEVA